MPQLFQIQIAQIQYSALAILFGRVFANNQIIGLFLIIFFGIFIPIYLIRREILKFFDRHSLIYIFFIISSYPVLFAFFRGNPVLLCSLWSILGVLAFISGGAFISRSSFLIGSLFHPVPAIFSVLFLRDRVVSINRKPL